MLGHRQQREWKQTIVNVCLIIFHIIHIYLECNCKAKKLRYDTRTHIIQPWSYSVVSRRPKHIRSYTGRDRLDSTQPLLIHQDQNRGSVRDSRSFPLGRGLRCNHRRSPRRQRRGPSTPTAPATQKRSMKAATRKTRTTARSFNILRTFSLLSIFDLLTNDSSSSLSSKVLLRERIRVTIF